jgi:FAD/FMN-containing dehydrogenase
VAAADLDADGHVDLVFSQRSARNYVAYGPAYERLRKIKGEYDPTNLFRLNSNIEPLV